MILSMKKLWPWRLLFLPGDKKSGEERWGEGWGGGLDCQCQLDFEVGLDYDAIILGGSLWDPLVFPN